MKGPFIINADLKKDNYIPKIKVTSNDTNTFIVNILDDGLPADLSNVTTVSLANSRFDKEVVVTNGTKNEENQVTFTIGTNETAVAGRVDAVVQLYDATGRVSTLAFLYEVKKDLTGNGFIPSVTEQTLIQIVLGDGPLILADATEAAAYANEQGDYALQVGVENETHYLNAVETVALRDSVYPNPAHGDTVRVTTPEAGLAKTYRFVTGAGWVITDVYNPTAIDEVTALLADTDEQLNTRIDEIITTPADGLTAITEQEIMDARQGKGSLGANIMRKVDTIKLKNIALNQNFLNSDNLTVVNATLNSVNNNEAYFVTTASYGQLRQSLIPVANHKYYVGVKFKCTNANAYLDAFNGSTQLAVKNHSGANAYELLDFIITPSATTTIQLRCVDPRSGYGSFVKEMVTINLTEIYGVGNEPSLVDFKTVLQSLTNSTYFFTNSNVTSFVDVVSKKSLQVVSDKIYKNVVLADFANKSFVISGKRSLTEDYTFEFKPYASNNIVSIYGVYKSTSSNPNPIIDKSSVLYTTATDWISPYKIKALANVDSPIVGDEWTGGAHTTTGITGEPTARTNKVRLFVDGKEVTVNGTYYGDEIELIVVNDIEGYNTHKVGNQRYIVEERIKYKIVGTKIDVHGTNLIKENAELKTYYAMQTVGYYDQIKYLDSANESYVVTTANSDSGVKSLYPLSDTRILKKITTGVELVVWFDNSYGLGKRDYLLNTQALLATYSYGSQGKTYTHLLVENPINFNAGDILNWRGYYWFK